MVSSMVKASLFVAVLVAVTSQSCHAHPTWARNKTLLCASLEPGHGAVAQPDSTFKDHFTLTASSGEAGVFNVRVDALNKDFGIVGYMIQARDACTGEILSGNWNTAQADQIMSCSSATNGVNAVHHRPRRSPAVAQVKHAWVPTNGVTSLQFVATIVHDKDTYWVMQAAPVLPCKGTNSGSNSPTVSRSIPAATRPAVSRPTVVRPAPVRPAPARPAPAVRPIFTRSGANSTTTTAAPAAAKI